MATADELNKAIGAHGLWKAKLQIAIETGKCDVLAGDARRDDKCEFGKWLLTQPHVNPRARRVTDLHKRFHGAVGSVLDAALAGKRADAQRLSKDGSEYANISMLLTREMMDWKREAN